MGGLKAAPFAPKLCHRRSSKCCLNVLWGERCPTKTHTRCVENSIGYCPSNRSGRWFARASWIEVISFDHHHVDCLRHIRCLQYWVAFPINTGHAISVKLYFLEQRAAGRLYDIAFGCELQSFRVDNKSVLYGCNKTARPDIAAVVRGCCRPSPNYLEFQTIILSGGKSWYRRVSSLGTIP